MRSFTQGMMKNLGGPGFNMLADYAKGNLGAEDMGKVEKAVSEGAERAGVNDSPSGIQQAMASAGEDL